MATQADLENLTGVKDDYAYGFHDEEKPVFKSKRGLNHGVIDQISDHKNEPDWMRKFRHEALDIFYSKPMPTWGADLSGIDFEEIFYYLKPSSGQGKSWDDVPEGIKNTFERLGIPEAERKFLAGVGAQYDSEVVYHSLRAEWEKLGVIFLDMDSGLREHEDIIREYFATIIPAADNKFAALNSAVWSGGSFVYVPKGVQVDIPLQAYFRINAENMGQFERTLIIVEEGASMHYVEGCTAPIYSSNSLHSAVVEIIVKKGARCRYTTIQNWSTDVYNLVTKRSIAEEGATMEWIDGNLGSKVTMKYPAVYMMGPRRMVKSCRSLLLAKVSIRTPVARSSTVRRTLVPRLSPSRLARTVAAPAIVGCSRWPRVRTTARATWFAMPCCSTKPAARTRILTSRSKRMKSALATKLR